LARQIAPRLANGETREPLYNGLPPAIKQGIDAIAKDENKSRSWVIEEALVDYFRLARLLGRKKYIIPSTWKKPTRRKLIRP
jgi:hypothetical protein